MEKLKYYLFEKKYEKLLDKCVFLKSNIDWYSNEYKLCFKELQKIRKILKYNKEVK